MRGIYIIFFLWEKVRIRGDMTEIELGYFIDKLYVDSVGERFLL